MQQHYYTQHHLIKNPNQQQLKPNNNQRKHTVKQTQPKPPNQIANITPCNNVNHNYKLLTVKYNTQTMSTLKPYQPNVLKTK